MAEAVSKTAKKSRGEIKKQLGKRCPGCGEAMVATRVMKLSGGLYYRGQEINVTPGGMYWICQKEGCGHREHV